MHHITGKKNTLRLCGRVESSFECALSPLLLATRLAFNDDCSRRIFVGSYPNVLGSSSVVKCVVKNIFRSIKINRKKESR